MVHSGYEASGVNYTFGSLKGMLQTAKSIFSSYDDAGAQNILNEWKPADHAPLVQIAGTPVTTTVHVEARALAPQEIERQEVSGD